jgi:hypothetical protein
MFTRTGATKTNAFGRNIPKKEKYTQMHCRSLLLLEWLRGANRIIHIQSLKGIMKNEGMQGNKSGRAAVSGLDASVESLGDVGICTYVPLHVPIGFWKG